MIKKNSVFIATSLDGYIADQKNSIAWLDKIPNPNREDMGYFEFMQDKDALVMGRNTFETVISFDVDWPYQIPVFVLSSTINTLPEKVAKEQVQFLSGSIKEILAQIHEQGYGQLYIDGGNVIQRFLTEDCIDELIISTIPVLLGAGISLFGDLTQPLWFQCTESKIYLEHIVQNRFIRNQQ